TPRFLCLFLPRPASSRDSSALRYIRPALIARFSSSQALLVSPAPPVLAPAHRAFCTRFAPRVSYVPLLRWLFRFRRVSLSPRLPRLPLPCVRRRGSACYRL